MSQMRIFLSHSSQDKAFADALVHALRAADADVWYDEQSLGAGHLLDVINRELASRPVFIVVLSKAAFASRWVTQECQWAFNLYSREPERVILPVTAQPIEPRDFNSWLFMESFKRIEASGGLPLSQPEAIAKTLQTLVLVPGSASHAAPTYTPQAQRTGLSLLWVDDRPSNNVHERRTLERMGITVAISTSTDDALGKLVQHHYEAIISDMSRPPDMRAGYTLLEQVRTLGVGAPFILYCGSHTPEQVAEAKRRGAYGQTSALYELLELVRSALHMS